MESVCRSLFCDNENIENIWPLKFPHKLWRLVNECRTGAIGWNKSGDAVIVDYELFKHDYLTSSESSNTSRSFRQFSNKKDDLETSRPVFKTSNMSSFVRQMNLYGFYKSTMNEKVNHNSRFKIGVYDDRQRGSEIHIFRNKNFLRGREDLVNRIVRNTSRHQSTLKGRTSQKFRPSNFTTGPKIKKSNLQLAAKMDRRLVVKSKKIVTAVSKPTPSIIQRTGPIRLLTSRTIRKCRSALTDALDRAYMSFKTKQAIHLLPTISQETNSQLADDIINNVIIDRDTEKIVEDYVNNYLDTFNQNILSESNHLQWLYDTENGFYDEPASVSMATDETDVDNFNVFETVNTEVLGINFLRDSSPALKTIKDMVASSTSMEQFPTSIESSPFDSKSLDTGFNHYLEHEYIGMRHEPLSSADEQVNCGNVLDEEGDSFIIRSDSNPRGMTMPLAARCLDFTEELRSEIRDNWLVEEHYEG